MKTTISAIQTELTEKLAALPDDEPMQRFQSATRVIDETLHQLKTELQNKSFTNDTDEINYYKYVRPAVLSLKMAEAIKYNLAVNQPIGTTEAHINYLEDALKGLQSFLQLNAFYYQYYKNHFTELDQIYFKKTSASLRLPVPEIADPDVASTPMSNLFAKFNAYETVQRYIIEKIERLSTGSNNYSLHDNNLIDLKWTGDVVNIVELAYGLWLTGQLNDGNASLNQIVKWLEANLQVNIGIAQRKFAEIARRKRLSVTKFIDKMKDAILGKIESDNE